MVLILSEDYDSSTSAVMDWLYHWKKDVIRFNKNDKISIAKIFLSQENLDVVFKIKDREINLSQVECFWYRRGEINIESFIFEPNFINQSSDIQSHLNYELETIRNFLYQLFLKKRNLSSILTSSPNKMVQLMEAKNCGLIIPKTLISSEKEILQNFLSAQGVITKSICEAPYFNKNESSNLIGYTSEVNKNDILDISQTFFPSLFQEKLDKIFELRIFFINKTFFPMAIFSQLDKKTEVDFRRYNFQRFSRNVPYHLPIEIEKKLTQLMKNLNLNTGSIDIVYTNKKEYVFLEVNPIGQFGMTSYPCNFNIEFEIAKFLCNRKK